MRGRANGGRAPSPEREMKTEVEELIKKLTRTRRPWSLRRARHAFERSYVQYMIRRSEGDRSRAAERLDIGFSTLKEKIRKN